jgi:hypothetical protein
LQARRRTNVLEGKIKIGRGQTLKERNRKLREARRAIWWDLTRSHCGE